MTVVFSTYQSIEVIARAQKELIKNGFGEFDLIICDEAHRTTGVSLAGEDESAFTKVHDNNFIKGKKAIVYDRYTTICTVMISKAKQHKLMQFCVRWMIQHCMEKKFIVLVLAKQLRRDLLTDYKVLILTLSDKDVPPAVQKMIAIKKVKSIPMMLLNSLVVSMHFQNKF